MGLHHRLLSPPLLEKGGQLAGEIGLVVGVAEVAPSVHSSVMANRK